MEKPESYYAGYESKRLEMAGMGFEAARDKFNSENPVGFKKYATPDASWFAYGEFDALCGRLEK